MVGYLDGLPLVVTQPTPALNGNLVRRDKRLTAMGQIGLIAPAAIQRFLVAMPIEKDLV